MTCTFTHGFLLDSATSVRIELDTCNLRFLPAHLASGIDTQISASKVLFSFSQGDAEVTLRAV
jgi:hypothetical protein